MAGLAGRWLHLGRKAAVGVVAVLVALYCAFYCTVGLLHYQAMNSHQTDLALIDQLVWGTLHGQFMHTTLQGFGVDSFLGFHVEPILALISPLYLAAPSAGTLVVVQTIGLAVAAIPLALWAHKRLDSGFAAVLVGLAFLLEPVLSRANDLLFEEIPLAVPFLAWALYFQLQRRWKPFAVCLLLALAVREEIAFVAMAMGLYALLVQKQRQAGWAILASGFAWAAISLLIVIPHFNGGHGLYWADAYGYLGGDTPFEIARNAATHPLLVLRHIVAPPRPVWVLSLLAPLGFLPLIGWRAAWMALPTLAYLLLGEGYYNPNSWYPTPMLPFLFLGAIEGIAALRRSVPAAAGAGYLAGAAAVSFHLAGGGPGTDDYAREAYIVTSHAAAARAMIRTIPPDAGVSATPQLIGHLSQRSEVSIFPELLIPRDVFAVDFKGWAGWHGYPAEYNEYDQALRRALHDSAYGAFYQGDGLLLLRRGSFPAAPAHPAAVSLGGKVDFLGWDGASEVRAGQPLTVHLRWRAASQLDQQYTLSLQFGNEANGKLAQKDGWPWDGYFPTVEWPAGQEVDDPETLMLPAGLAPGPYRLFVSLYAVENGQVKPLTAPPGEGGVTLGPFTVSP